MKRPASKRAPQKKVPINKPPLNKGAANKEVPPQPRPQGKMPQVQHDALIAGGGFTMIGGVLMAVSVLLPWVLTQVGGVGSTVWSFDLLSSDLAYLVIFAASFLGAFLVVMTSLTMFKVFVSHRPLNSIPIVQSVLAMAAPPLVIAPVLLLQRDYQGWDALYGAGAFIDVVGAILVMAGALLIQMMSGKKAKPSATGFQALAERSAAPGGRKEWKPPETSVKAPRCPTCGEELHPGWKACPNCGHALIKGDLEERDSL